MNKKLNTALFMIGATVFNLLLLFVLLILGWVLIAALKLPPLLLIVVFLAAMVGSFLIYNQVVKFIARKIDMEKYFLPLFKRRPPKQGG
jgi:hypothetical protein